MANIIKHFQEYEYLYDRLNVYSAKDYYPFHMPGHKRADLPFKNPYQIDITEIEGFDNLHHAQGILKKSQIRLQELYKSKRAYYLINGSTGGILSAVGSLIHAGEKVLVSRNCHKSVYNAVKLFQLKAHYVYPKFINYDIQGPVDPKDIEKAFIRTPDIKLVVITSPTYEGIVSDIQKIATIVHKYQAYLIVDEAHGAHFPFSDIFPKSAISQGADLVIQSLHKTLPCFTQTAALHVASDRVDYKRVEEMLGIFQTSSPSYLLMAGIDQCVRLLTEHGKQLFDEYCQRLAAFYEKCNSLRYLHVVQKKDFVADRIPDLDPSKIVIGTWSTNLHGQFLYRKLLEEYHLQLELYSADYVLAMTSIMDTEQGFERLFDALFDIEIHLKHDYKEELVNHDVKKFLKRAYAVREKVFELADIGHFVEDTLLQQCKGKICAEFIYLYPPGIPMIVPGEVITQEFIDFLEECRSLELCVQGTKNNNYRKILTVAQDNKI